MVAPADNLVSGIFIDFPMAAAKRDGFFNMVQGLLIFPLLHQDLCEIVMRGRIIRVPGNYVRIPVTRLLILSGSII